MKSLRDLYKIGRGPSSSHTMGPQKAARLFAQAFPEAERHVVTLYGSLAKTGEGHGTDAVLRETLAPKEVALRFDRESETPHPNTMDFSAWSGEEELGAWRVFSVGGRGSLPMRRKRCISWNSLPRLQSIAGRRS